MGVPLVFILVGVLVWICGYKPNERLILGMLFVALAVVDIIGHSRCALPEGWLP